MFMIYGNEDLKTETSHQGTWSVEVTKRYFLMVLFPDIIPNIRMKLLWG